MKRIVLKFTIVFFCTMALLGARPVFADVNDFIITNFDADYTLSADDPQGLLKVHEEISVDFSDNNNGIFRTIPNI